MVIESTPTIDDGRRIQPTTDEFPATAAIRHAHEWWIDGLSITTNVPTTDDDATAVLSAIDVDEWGWVPTTANEPTDARAIIVDVNTIIITFHIKFRLWLQHECKTILADFWCGADTTTTNEY